MKKNLVVIMAVGLFACLAAGCGGGDTETYTDPAQEINAKVNQDFIIALGSNPTTGYSWQADYDVGMLELVGGESTYETGAQAGQGLVGAGGTEYFTFKALKAGSTDVTLVYVRPWEEESIEQRVFSINIK